MTQKDFETFAATKLKVKFKDISLLEQALTHRSWLNEQRRIQGLENNERLEFLGDAVLELVCTDYLYRNYKEPEGILTNWRSALVRTESIGAAAEKLGLYELIKMSRGERKSESDRAKLQMLANAFEAVIGAIYLDQGYEQAEEFVTEHILTTLPAILETGSWQDAKSHLQELVQAKESLTPTYKVLTEEGPDHDKTFTMGVMVGGKLRGKGVGPSKQAAQQAAAETALKEIKRELSQDS